MEHLLADWRLRMQILLQVDQVDDVQLLVPIQVVDSERYLVVVLLLVIVEEWVHLLQELEQRDLLAIEAISHVQVEKLAKVRTVIFEHELEVRQEVPLLKEYLRLCIILVRLQEILQVLLGVHLLFFALQRSERVQHKLVHVRAQFSAIKLQITVLAEVSSRLHVAVLLVFIDDLERVLTGEVLGDVANEVGPPVLKQFEELGLGQERVLLLFFLEHAQELVRGEVTSRVVHGTLQDGRPIERMTHAARQSL